MHEEKKNPLIDVAVRERKGEWCVVRETPAEKVVTSLRRKNLSLKKS